MNKKKVLTILVVVLAAGGYLYYAKGGFWPLTELFDEPAPAAAGQAPDAVPPSQSAETDMAARDVDLPKNVYFAGEGLKILGHDAVYDRATGAVSISIRIENTADRNVGLAILDASRDSRKFMTSEKGDLFQEYFKASGLPELRDIDRDEARQVSSYRSLATGDFAPVIVEARLADPAAGLKGGELSITRTFVIFQDGAPRLVDVHLKGIPTLTKES